jgi:hypothetical protein
MRLLTPLPLYPFLIPYLDTLAFLTGTFPIHILYYALQNVQSNKDEAVTDTYVYNNPYPAKKHAQKQNTLYETKYVTSMSIFFDRNNETIKYVTAEMKPSKIRLKRVRLCAALISLLEHYP